MRVEKIKSQYNNGDIMMEWGLPRASVVINSKLLRGTHTSKIKQVYIDEKLDETIIEYAKR